MSSIRTWKQRTGIQIDEVEFHDDAHAFKVYFDGKHFTTIYTYSREGTVNLRVRFDAGQDVRDFEDGNGHSIETLIAERTGDGLRETLKRIEDAGTCYNEELYPGRFGTLWTDEANHVYYEYETDDLDISVDDLTDEELKDVMIGGI